MRRSKRVRYWALDRKKATMTRLGVSLVTMILGMGVFAGPLAAAQAAEEPRAAEKVHQNARTPDAFARNNRLGRGVNVLGYDPIWKDQQKARFQEKYFRLIQEAGFNHVRVNLHPFRDAKPGADGKPSAAWFEALDWAIEHALANRLVVILDFHEFQAMGDDPAGKKDRFLAVWRQIAEHCKDAPDDVVFEILNEPNKKLTAELWNPMLRAALAIIRKSNPRRTVVVGPTSWNGIKDLDKLDLPERDQNLIVTVHYYSPFPFTHQGAAFAGLKDKTGVPWNGTGEEQRAILKDFDKAQAWAEKHHRTIYLGEFGAYDKADMAARVRWASFVAREAEKRTWSWAWWQFDGDFVLYDVRRDRWVEPIRRALVPSAVALPGPANSLLFPDDIECGMLVDEAESRKWRDVERELLLEERTSEARKYREIYEFRQMEPVGPIELKGLLPAPQGPPPTPPAR